MNYTLFGGLNTYEAFNNLRILSKYYCCFVTFETKSSFGEMMQLFWRKKGDQKFRQIKFSISTVISSCGSLKIPYTYGFLKKTFNSK